MRKRKMGSSVFDLMPSPGHLLGVFPEDGRTGGQELWKAGVPNLSKSASSKRLGNQKNPESSYVKHIGGRLYLLGMFLVASNGRGGST